MNGYIDEFELLPYCDHPNATAYSVPTGAKSIATAGYAGDWFDLSSFTMKTPSAASVAAGTNPTFTISNKLYVGEATTNTTTVTNAISYAYQGKFVSNPVTIAVNTTYVYSHNIGVPLEFLQKASVKFKENAATGWKDATSIFPASGTGSSFTGYHAAGATDRNTYRVTTAGTYVDWNESAAGVTSGFHRVQLSRAF